MQVVKRDTHSRRLCHEAGGRGGVRRHGYGTMSAIMRLHENQPLSDAPARVTVYPTDVSDYTAQVYAGLFELEAQGEVVLSVRRCPDRRLDAPHTVYLEIDGPRQTTPQRLLIDLIDSAVLQAPQALTLVDCYAKRSLRETTDSAAPGVRFIPYGLQYAARSTAMSARQQAMLHWRAVYRGGQSYGLRQKVDSALQAGYRLIRRRTAFSQTAPMYISAFEGKQVAKAARIFFSTRVYGEDEAPYAADRQAANDMRVALIRALRAAFGDRYVGGLRPSLYAHDHYADCIVVNPDNRTWHHDMGLASLIHVNSAGLHGSTGWKFAEALAQSSCLVSEPSLDRQPEPCRDGEHFLAFATIDQCVAHCENLLQDTKRATELRESGHRYYQRHVRPEALMRACLRSALISESRSPSSGVGEKFADAG